MAFLTEPEPPRGVATPVHDGVRRLVACNPSVMTYRGTNTYLIDTPHGLTVLDPGPDDPQHVADILAQAGGPIAHILLSHSHHDHLGAVAGLRAATGAPVYAWHAPAAATFVPDVALHDGDEAVGLVALHTPGHAADHVCFAAPGGLLFSADHVMSWSSSIVSPPGGNMARYFASLQRLLDRSDAAYLPGHGPKLPDPRPFVQDLLDHRRTREAAILAALTAEPITSRALMERLYSQVDPMLRQAAERNVVAHLEKLGGEGRAMQDDLGWRRAA